MMSWFFDIADMNNDSKLSEKEVKDTMVDNFRFSYSIAQKNCITTLQRFTMSVTIDCIAGS